MGFFQKILIYQNHVKFAEKSERFGRFLGCSEHVFHRCGQLRNSELSFCWKFVYLNNKFLFAVRGGSVEQGWRSLLLLSSVIFLYSMIFENQRTGNAFSQVESSQSLRMHFCFTSFVILLISFCIWELWEGDTTRWSDWRETYLRYILMLVLFPYWSLIFGFGM